MDNLLLKQNRKSTIEYNEIYFSVNLFQDETSISFVKTSSIAVSSNTIYVAGHFHRSGSYGGDTAVYWKNGTPVLLGAGYSNSIAVNGNGVYVSGWDNTLKSAVYWKNGTPILLNNGIAAYSIFLAPK